MVRITDPRTLLLVLLAAGCTASAPVDDGVTKPEDTAIPDTGSTDSGGDDTSTPIDTGTPTVPPDPDWTLINDIRLVGRQPNDRLGYAFTLGDADGDGDDEIVVGALWQPYYPYYKSPPPPEVDSGTKNAATFLLDGVPTSGVVDAAALHGWTQREDWGFGQAVVGDVTGDGIVDLAISGQGTLGEEGYDGVLWVFSPPYGGLSDEEDALAWVGIPEPGGPRPEELLPCGDINGDGAVDLCTLAENELRAYFGPLSGEVPADAAGLSLAAELATHGHATHGVMVDFDGTGSPAVVVAYSTSFSSRGTIYRADPPLEGVVDLESTAVTWEGDGGHAGIGLAAGGDLDGDGHEDLFVGAPLHDDRNGRAYVLLDGGGGRVAEAPIQFEPRHPGDFIGYDAAIADFDADGHDDLALSAPRDLYFAYDRPGRVLVFPGPLVPGTYGDDEATLKWIASEVPDFFGFRVEAGDIDGDGRADLLASSPYDTVVEYQEGSLTILLGGGL